MITKSTLTSCLAAGITLVCSSAAHAQSSVRIFGMIDAGASYFTNSGDKSHVHVSDGINGPNLLGFTGDEDLGGGTKATFQLINQFLLNKGSFLTNQNLFTRTALVGLTDSSMGSLTFGNQYDYVNDYLYAVGNDPALYSGHLHGQYSGPFQNLTMPLSSNGDSDWFRASGRFANSVKYVSPTFAGFSAAGMYALGEAANASNSSSFALNYLNGTFGVNAVYTLGRYADSTGKLPETELRKSGIGARYQVAGVNVSGMYLVIKNNTTGAQIYEATTGANWFATNFLNIGVSYAYVKGNDVLNNSHGNQFNVIGEYFLSKRTSLYTMAVYQRASSGARASITGTGIVSDGQNEMLTRVGMRVKF